MPRLDEGALTVTTTKLPGISVPSAVEAQTMVERHLERFAVAPGEYEYPLAFRVYEAVNG